MVCLQWTQKSLTHRDITTHWPISLRWCITSLRTTNVVNVSMSWYPHEWGEQVPIAIWAYRLYWLQVLHHGFIYWQFISSTVMACDRWPLIDIWGLVGEEWVQCTVIYSTLQENIHMIPYPLQFISPHGYRNCTCLSVYLSIQNMVVFVITLKKV